MPEVSSTLPSKIAKRVKGNSAMRFVGNDWAEDHQDVEVVEKGGKVLARRRLPEGLGCVTRLHMLLAKHEPPERADFDPASPTAQNMVGIGADRGPCVGAPVAAGYTVHGGPRRDVATRKLGSPSRDGRLAHPDGPAIPKFQQGRGARGT